MVQIVKFLKGGKYIDQEEVAADMKIEVFQNDDHPTGEEKEYHAKNDKEEGFGGRFLLPENEDSPIRVTSGISKITKLIFEI